MDDTGHPATAYPARPLMRLVLDADHLRQDMLARRATTDMQLPMNDSVRVHLVTGRAELLAGFSATAAGWMLLLHACSVDPADRAEFERLKHDVLAFKEWADQGLADLHAGERTRCGIARERMPDDPKLVASLRKLLRPTPASGRQN